MLEQGMFADSLLETSWAQRTRRNWTTLTSFGLEALAIGLLLLLPLWKTVGLPSAHSLSTPISLGRPTVEPVAPRPRSGPASPNTNAVVIRPIMEPSQYSNHHRSKRRRCRTATSRRRRRSGSCKGRDRDCRMESPASESAPCPSRLPLRLRSSAQSARRSCRKAACFTGCSRRIRRRRRIARIQGPVVLAAVISKAGAIENLRVLSGHPMLVKAAIDAVSEWRYRPYILNNEPVEVETQITVNFTLGGS